jgi:hypothetical protein
MAAPVRSCHFETFEWGKFQDSCFETNAQRLWAVYWNTSHRQKFKQFGMFRVFRAQADGMCRQLLRMSY